MSELKDYDTLEWFDCKNNFPPMRRDLYVDSEHGYGIGRLGRRVKDKSIIWTVHLDSGDVYQVYAFYKVKRWAYMPKDEKTNTKLKYELMMNKERSWVPCYLKSEADKVIEELKSENRFIKERLDQQEKAFKWHKVENLFGKPIGDLPSRDLNRVYGRDFLVHYTVIIGGRISDGIAYSDYDDDEGFFELENGCTPVHWCEVPLPPLADKLKEGV